MTDPDEVLEILSKPDDVGVIVYRAVYEAVETCLDVDYGPEPPDPRTIALNTLDGIIEEAEGMKTRSSTSIKTRLRRDFKSSTNRCTYPSNGVR